MSTNTDELKRLAEAATSGGWFEYGNDKQISVCAQPDGRFTYVIPMVKGNQSYRKDAKFIAAANPSAILSLIEEVEGLREMFGKLQVENVTLREELDKAQACLKQVDLLTQYSNGTPEAQMFAVQQLVRDLRASAFTQRHKKGESDE